MHCGPPSTSAMWPTDEHAHLRVIQLGCAGSSSSSSATASSIAASVSAGNGCDASHLHHHSIAWGEVEILLTRGIGTGPMQMQGHA